VVGEVEVVLDLEALAAPARNETRDRGTSYAEHQ